MNEPFTVEDSGAFVELFELPPTSTGPLDGLRFAVKDLIDVVGRTTGCGNPRWRETHPPAPANAVCVDQLLAAGARCVGKTISDELAFSLLGESHFFGTPLNPKAPGRVPGGSSSGSASAVACGLCDFALGTDTGGSVRVPAANCGLFGIRPSHGLVSVAGVMSFAPGFDTVGWFARSADILARVGSVLLACDVPARAQVGEIYLVEDAFALADPGVQQALSAPVERLKDRFGGKVRPVLFRDLVGEQGLRDWYDAIFRPVQWAEIWSSLGAWIEQTRPELGPATEATFALTRGLDRPTIGPAVRRRESLARRLQGALEPGNMLVIPTAPSIAPLKGSIRTRSQDTTDYYPRALALTSISGIGRLPQVTLPLSEADGAPAGLSLLAPHGRDDLLLAAAAEFTGH
jgi:amidase